jgi:curved DNA-binding protein CbpA
MIVLEITDESGTSHYEILGVTREALHGASEKEVAKEVRNAAKRAKRELQVAANRGDRDAEGKVALINNAETCLKDQGRREEYDKHLDAGKGGSLEILRIQPIAPPFFRERAARFLAIESLLREAGLA